MKSYGIVLLEKEMASGLTKDEVINLLNMLEEVTELYPIEFEARVHECSAMGFITVEAAEWFGYDYESSGLHDFIADILDDMSNESGDCNYEYKAIKIWLGR